MELVAIPIVSDGSNLNIDNSAGGNTHRFHEKNAADVNTYCIDNAADGNTYCVWWFKLQYRQCS